MDSFFISEVLSRLKWLPFVCMYMQTYKHTYYGSPIFLWTIKNQQQQVCAQVVVVFLVFPVVK